MGIKPWYVDVKLGRESHKGLAAMLTNPPIPYDPISRLLYLSWVNARLASCLNSALNVKALVGAFNQEKALVGASSVIVQLHR